MPALAGAECGIRGGGLVVIVVGEDSLARVCQSATSGAYERADIVVDEVGSGAFSTGHPRPVPVIDLICQQ